MQLKVLLPTHVLVDTPVTRVAIEAVDGARTFLPRHIDFVTVLVPSLFVYVTEDGEQVYMAMSDGVLVKRGEQINVSARNAVRGDDLDTLWATVHRDFQQLDERERQARSVLADLETTLARQLARLGDQTGSF